MIKIYLVNLDDSHERLAIMQKQFSSLGLEFIRTSAVNGKLLNDFREGFNTRKFKSCCFHDLVPGEAGCSQSHIKIWQKMLNDGDKYICVIEDDITISPSFTEFLSNEKNYNEFDYLKLDHIDKVIAEYMDSNQRDKNKKPKDLIKVIKNNNFISIECKSAPYHTAAYIISDKAARIFLNSSKNMYYPIDLLPWHTFPYTRQGFVYPKIAFHDDEGESSISNRIFIQRHKKLSDRILYIINRIFSKARLRHLSVFIRKLILNIH